MRLKVWHVLKDAKRRTSDKLCTFQLMKVATVLGEAR